MAMLRTRVPSLGAGDAAVSVTMGGSFPMLTADLSVAQTQTVTLGGSFHMLTSSIDLEYTGPAEVTLAGSFPMLTSQLKIADCGDVWNYPVDGEYSVADVMRGLFSVLCGDRTGGPGGTVFKAPGTSTARVTTTADQDGNGTAVLSITGSVISDRTACAEIEGTTTAVEIFRALAAVAMGARSGGPGSTVFTAIDGSKPRVSTTADVDGNGSATLDMS